MIEIRSRNETIHTVKRSFFWNRT